MAKIVISCSECGHEARVPEAFRNKKVRCLRCHAKLRVPEDAPYAESRSRPRTAQAVRPNTAVREVAKSSPPVARRSERRRQRKAEGGSRGPSSKTRREAMGVIRELLHEYDHAIESVPRGFEIDLRGVAFTMARTLVEELLDCQAIRDVKLAGGTGHCRLVVTLDGFAWNPDDSFADEDEDTEVFQRSPQERKQLDPQGLIDAAIGIDEQTDPAVHLDQDLEGKLVEESTMASLFQPGNTTRNGADPLALYEKALEHIDDGEPREAVPLLEKAVRADKKFSRAVHALGKAYASIGDFTRARRAFRHMAKLEQNDPEAHVLYAAAAVKCDRLDEAKAALRAAIKIDPEYMQAYRYAAQLYDRLGEPEKARKFRARYQSLKLRG